MPRASDRHDAIVVLGGTVLDDGELAPWVAARVERALEAFDSGVAARVIFTGRTGVYGPAQPAVTEAAAMAAYAKQRGLPAEVVLLEEHALDRLV
jgi:vancomycin permeability regulator SanA